MDPLATRGVKREDLQDGGGVRRGDHLPPHKYIKNAFTGGFPGGAVVENLPANAGDTGSSPGLGRSHMLRSS